MSATKVRPARDASRYILDRVARMIEGKGDSV